MMCGITDDLKQKKANGYMKYIQISTRKKADHDPTPEMVHFLTGHGSFAAKLAQMNLKDSDKCTSGSEQTTKHLWESCPRSELEYLHGIEYGTEPDKNTTSEDKYKEFQLLLKEIEKRLRDEENQSRIRNVGNRPAR